MMRKNFLSSAWFQQPLRGLVLVGILCLLIRLPLLSNQPSLYPDTRTYITMADHLCSLDFSGYTGERTPLYPLLLCLSGMNFSLIWWGQSFLGIAISLLLYAIAYGATRSTGLSAAAGLSYSLCIHSVFFEANILTETLATFLLVLSVWLFARIWQRNSAAQERYALALGCVVGLATLARPMMLFLVPLYFVALLYNGWRSRSPHGFQKLVVYTIPTILLIGGWCLFNQLTVGYFGVTTLFGYNLTQHSGRFMELVPDDEAAIRDIYLRYRAEYIKKNGTHSMTIWRAIPDLQAATGLSYSALSKKMGQISLQLFAAYPQRYAESVGEAWEGFWRPSMTWMSLENISPLAFRMGLRYLRMAEEWLLTRLNVVFLWIGLWYVTLVIWKRAPLDSIFMIVGIVFVASISQALVEYGENSRYAIPFQPLMLYVVLWAIYNFTKLSPSLLRTQELEVVPGESSQ